MKFRNVMFDAETLGTVADSVIMSIGAVKFDLESDAIDDAGFYASISIDSNLDFRRRIQEDTLMWWLKQSAEAQKVFFEPKMTLHEALCSLGDWLDHDDYSVWSMGADFDIPMLAHAFTQQNIEIPWKHWNNRCARTYKALPQAANVKLARQGVHHNALDDAVHQAKLVQAIHRELTKKAVKV